MVFGVILCIPLIKSSHNIVTPHPIAEIPGNKSAVDGTTKRVWQMNGVSFLGV